MDGRARAGGEELGARVRLALFRSALPCPARGHGRVVRDAWNDLVHASVHLKEEVPKLRTKSMVLVRHVHSR